MMVIAERKDWPAEGFASAPDLFVDLRILSLTFGIWTFRQDVVLSGWSWNSVLWAMWAKLHTRPTSVFSLNELQHALGELGPLGD